MKQIPITRGHHAIIDDEDFERLSSFKWYAHESKKSKSIYCFRKRNHILLLMHREILGLTNRNDIVDHIDGNGLNNQKSNLRICTHRENLRNSKLSSKNTTGFKGVYYHKPTNKFMAYIRLNYKLHYLGLYKTSEEAAKARNLKAKELHGEFAYLNKV